MGKYMRGHIGEIHYSNEGCRIEIVDGGDKLNNCKIKVYGGYKIYNYESNYTTIKNGSIKNPYLIYKYHTSKVGEIYPLRDGFSALIIKGGTKSGYCIAMIYSKDMSYVDEVRFESIANARLKNNYRRTVCGIGFLGIGDHVACINGCDTPAYIKWHSMICRCYSDKFIENNPSYKNVIVCDEWHNFQNFADWYEDNYRDYGEEIVVLDKDLIGDGSLYSPKTCCIIPIMLNNFFSKIPSTNSTGVKGVSFSNGFYYASGYNIGSDKLINLGLYKNKLEAIKAVSNHKKTNTQKIINKCLFKWNINNKKIIDSLIEIMNKYDKLAH